MTGDQVPELPCAELVEVVTDFFEARLGPVDHGRFEAHLAECPGCAEYVSQLRRTVDALGRLRAEELSLHPRA